MDPRVKEAREEVLDTFNEYAKTLNDQEYQELLEELICDLEAKLEAKRNE